MDGEIACLGTEREKELLGKVRVSREDLLWCSVHFLGKVEQRISFLALCGSGEKWAAGELLGRS